MKRRNKKLMALVIGTAVVSSVLAGCSVNSISIYQAANKTKTITSGEVRTDVTLKVSAKNMSKQEQADMGETLKEFNNAELHMYNKFSTNKEKTVLKAQTEINAKAGSDSFKTSIWTNSDASTDKPVTTETFTVPKEVSNKILDIKGKDYVVATTAGDVQADNTDLANYKKIAALEPKLTAFLEAYMKNYNPVNDPIKNVGKTTIQLNGSNKKQEVQMYRLVLTDSTLKTLAHYTVNNLSDNKESFSLLKDYLVSVAGAVAPTKEDAANSVAEIENGFALFNNNVDVIEKQLDAELSVFDKVKVVGDKGIVVNFAVDKNGYIVKEEGDVQVVVDTPAIAKATGDTENKSTGVYTVDLHFSNDITNINGNVAINYPKTTKDNAAFMKFSDVFNLPNIISAHEEVDKTVKEAKDVEKLEALKAYVNSLPDGKDKTVMLAQINTAEQSLQVAQAKELVKKAKTNLSVLDYESALAAVNKLPESVKKPLLAELTGVSSKVYTADVNAGLNVVKNFTADKKKDLRKFDAAKKAIIDSVKSTGNENYLIGKLNGASKEVYTAEVNNALKAIDTAKKKYSADNVKAAKTAISKVKNTESAKYLQEMLTKAKPKTLF